MSVPDDTEVVFLLLHYLRSLDAGPRLASATDALESALADSRLLPSVLDFTGASRIASYEQCARRFPHIPPRYLPRALAERIPTTPVPVNTLFGTGRFNTVPRSGSVSLSRNAASSKRKPNLSSRGTPSNYSVSAYRKKHSWSIKNIHALLEQMHVLGRPMPLHNVVYSVLPKQMRRLKRLVGHHQPVYCSIYDFSGEYIITGSDDHQLKVWSTRNAYLCHTLRGHEREITDINADPARRIIVSADRDASVRVWDLVTGRNTHVLNAGGKCVHCVLFSPCPDRPYLLSGGDDGTACLWNTRNFEQQALVIPIPRPNRRGQTVGTVGGVRGTGSTPANTFGDSFPAQSPVVGADSVPASSPSRTPSRMSSPPPQPQQSNNMQPALQTTAMHPPPSATLINSVGESDLDPRSQLQSLNEHMQQVLQVQPGQPRVDTTGAQTSAVRVQDMSAQTGPPLASGDAVPQAAASTANSAANNSVVSASPATRVLSVAFNTGATRLAISGSDCLTHVYSIEKEIIFGSLPTVRFLTTLRGHSGSITQVLFAQEGDRLCTASEDGTARIWRRINARIPTKPRARVVPGQGNWKSIVLDCRLSASDVPSMSNGGGGAASTSITPRIPHHRIQSSVNAVLWSNRDEYVVSSSSDAKIRIWNSDTGQLVHILAAHSRKVYIMDTHPFDKRIILSAGYDGKCILWDIEKGIELCRFSTENRGTNSRITDANPSAYNPNVMDGKFSPDGLSFSVTDTSGALTIFGVDSGESMALAPEEQFFSNDSIPFRWDEQQRAVSQDTGQLLHFLPKGDLCDSQLRRHPPELHFHSQNFHQHLPGSDENRSAFEAKSEGKMLNARGEEFRRNEDKEERRLLRAAREERKRIWREREKAKIDSLYDDLPARSIKDFVVSDSERESDGDFKVEENEFEASSDEDNDTMEDSDVIRPVQHRNRKRKRLKKRVEQSPIRCVERNWNHNGNLNCNCKENVVADDNEEMSDGASNSSDESFHVESDDVDSDVSVEPSTTRRRDPRAHLRPRSRARAASTPELDAKVRASSSNRKMRIHLSRPESDFGQDELKDKMDLEEPGFDTEMGRSPLNRSFTSERRAGSARLSVRHDEDSGEDEIEPIHPDQQSVDKLEVVSGKRKCSTTQWSAHSRPGPDKGAKSMLSSVAAPNVRRRSPRNRPATRSKLNREANINSDFDLEEFSRREVEQLKESTETNENPVQQKMKKSKRIRSLHNKKTRSSNRDIEGKMECPVHGIQKAEAVSGAESDDSDGSVHIRRKRRRVKSHSKIYEANGETYKSLGSLVPYVVESANPLLASEWLRQTCEKYNYVPQRGDSIVYFPKGHIEAIAQSRKLGINPLVTLGDSSTSLKHRLDASMLSDSVGPLQFIISSISYDFHVHDTQVTKKSSPRKLASVEPSISRTVRNVALLTLHRNQKHNWPLNVPEEVTLPYFPLDDVPEYVVLASRVEAAISSKWEPEDRFRMLFVNEKRMWQYYSGIVRRVTSGYPYMGWNSVEVEYDNDDDPDKGSIDIVSPWELEAIVVSKGSSIESSTTKFVQPRSCFTKPALFIAIANEISALQASDPSWKTTESWLDTVQTLSADSKYCQKVACPIDLQVILTRLCTAFYRHYEAFLDDVELLKANALKYNGKISEVTNMAISMHSNIVRVAERTKMDFSSREDILLMQHKSRSTKPISILPEKVHTRQTGNSAIVGRSGCVPLAPRLAPAVLMAPANGHNIPESLLGTSINIPSRGSHLAKAGSASSAINRPHPVSNIASTPIIAPLPPVPAIYNPNGSHVRVSNRAHRVSARSAQTGRVQASPENRMRFNGSMSGTMLPAIHPHLPVTNGTQMTSLHSIPLPLPSAVQSSHPQLIPAMQSPYPIAPRTTASRSFPLSHVVNRGNLVTQRTSVATSNSLANLLSPPIVTVNGTGFISNELPNNHPGSILSRRGNAHDGGTVSCGGSIEAAGGQNGPFPGHATTSESRVQFWRTAPSHPNNSLLPLPRTDGGPSTSATLLHGHAPTGNVASSSAIQLQENSRHEHSSISIAAAESTMSCGGENANVGESTENGRE